MKKAPKSWLAARLSPGCEEPGRAVTSIPEPRGLERCPRPVGRRLPPATERKQAARRVSALPSLLQKLHAFRG